MQHSDYDAPELLRALTEVTEATLGRGGSFPGLANNHNAQRTEEILLLLLRHGVVVKAHQRRWYLPIPLELESDVIAAGGTIVRPTSLEA